jgi:hypothetical protein
LKIAVRGHPHKKKMNNSYRNDPRLNSFKSDPEILVSMQTTVYKCEDHNVLVSEIVA